eukprot:jgi/Phyca11/13105/fgenesh1_pg.PHYCAscaffold_2_\
MKTARIASAGYTICGSDGSVQRVQTSGFAVEYFSVVSKPCVCSYSLHFSKRRKFSSGSFQSPLSHSTSDISRSSQDPVINLAQDGPDADEETSTEVPSLARPKKSTNWIRDYLRTRTDNERAQQQLLLRHNRQEIQRMEESKRHVP